MSAAPLGPGRPHLVMVALLASMFGATGAAAASAPPAPAPAEAADWQRCASMALASDRLACFDAWAGRQGARAVAVSDAARAAPAEAAPRSLGEAADATPCHDPKLPSLVRAWELEREADCGVFTIRGYRPISLSVITADRVNSQPQSENPLNNASTALPYRRAETRVQLSVRTKIAQGLLTGDGPLRDSLWFAYTQQSYWQLFTGTLSRPFRSTDHEPEFIYVMPTALDLPRGWRLRYGGLGVVHQSNGQSLPLSRSWNRVYLMAGADHAGGLGLQARYWKRFNEKPDQDDNPSISDSIGRAEVIGTWQASARHQFSLTLRHSMRSDARGSVRLEWLSALGRPSDVGLLGGLRLHTQLFSGYGDSLLDYNRRRTVLSVGVSLVDW